MSRKASGAKKRGPTESDVKPLNPIFAWFGGGDVIQFGELCGSCPEKVKAECRSWEADTLAGLRAKDTRVFRDCPYFVKWDKERYTREKLSKDDIAEGDRNVDICPDCGQKDLRRAVRTSSEYGSRMNPRGVFLEWCGCGRFVAVKKEFHGTTDHCVFCGGRTKGTEMTMFRGAAFHLDCFLRLRFFLTMSEMLHVAEGYVATGKTLGSDESRQALQKTLETVRAFRLTGNGNVIGVNRVIHWLEGDSPVVSERTVLRTKEDLRRHLEATFTGESERAVGVQILEDAYIVYDNAAAVRWITHGAYRPVKDAGEFIDRYIELAREGNWSELDKKYLVPDCEDGKCAVCGATTRSHRIASGEDGKNVYSCHHCWIGRTGERATGNGQ